MERRSARLRQEYLYRKSLEGKQREDYEKRCAVRRALQEGKAIPTELRAESAALHREALLEDDNSAVPRTHIDDEYANVGVQDPRVLVTTSRDPSSKLISFAKELALVIPNAKAQNRGAIVLEHLVASARASDTTDIVVVHEHRGQPDGLAVCHLPFGPTAYFGVHHCVLRHDIGTKRDVGTVSEVYPNLILNNFTTQIGKRFATVLKALFPVPRPTNKRLVTFSNKNDYISFRHHVYSMLQGPRSLELTEVGPRFELHPYKIRLGTLADNHAEDEWVLHAFVRSASKRKRLADEEAGPATNDVGMVRAFT